MGQAWHTAWTGAAGLGSQHTPEHPPWPPELGAPASAPGNSRHVIEKEKKNIQEENHYDAKSASSIFLTC